MPASKLSFYLILNAWTGALAFELPPAGGNTYFANQYLAYETLSEGLKRTLDQLTGISSSLKADASKTREDALRAANDKFERRFRSMEALAGETFPAFVTA